MTRTGRIAILTAGTCIVLATAVRAEADESMQSRGTIRFQGTEGIVQTWTEDIMLLQEKVRGIPVQAFAPEEYS